MTADTRYIANTAILAKTETTPGVDPVPVPATDALLVSDCSITPLDATMVDRNLMLPYFGGSEELLVRANVKFSCSTELSGSGTAGTAPPWTKLALACAAASLTLTTPARTEIVPVSTSLKTLGAYYVDDKLQHAVLGSMGNFKISAKTDNIPKLSFDFLGARGGETVVSNPTTTLTMWKVPPTMNEVNVIDITLGGTYAAGAVSGGTQYSSTGLEVDIGNRSQWIALLSKSRADITGRKTTGKMVLELTAAQEAAFIAAIEQNASTQSLALTIGTAAGNKFILWFPKAQMKNPAKDQVNGVRMVSFDINFVPLNGNDEWRIVCL